MADAAPEGAPEAPEAAPEAPAPLGALPAAPVGTAGTAVLACSAISMSACGTKAATRPRRAGGPAKWIRARNGW